MMRTGPCSLAKKVVSKENDIEVGFVMEVRVDELF